VLCNAVIGGVLLPLALGIIEITHRRSKDVVLIRVQADSLAEADLSGAFLLGADLTGMQCAGANFRDAKLVRATFHEADLRGADLRGADLSGATLSGADLSGALFDTGTRWPTDFDPEAHGARYSEPEE
jgi:uncharacterized protein YjbI with pentapeptide repeats